MPNIIHHISQLLYCVSVHLCFDGIVFIRLWPTHCSYHYYSSQLVGIMIQLQLDLVML